MDRDVPQELPARRGFTISYRGKTLLSKIDPVSQGERLAAGIPVKERTLYLCPSPLYGYGLPVLLEKLRSDPNSKNSAILCVEADERLFGISQKAFAEYEAPHENFPSPALIKASSPEQVCAFARKTWGERIFRRLEIFRPNGGWQLFPKLYDDIEAALRREIALEWGNAMTLIRLGRLYSRNLIRNLALLPSGENIGNLTFGAAPVLVLGAGPSLDSALDELGACPASIRGESGRAGRRFKIICVDTCLPALHERGILPDLVVILESQHWNLKDFSGAAGRKIDAAIDMSALPASARVLGGRRFYFATPWTHLALFTRLGKAGLLPETFAPLGSVGPSAVALALSISSGPVLTSGIDFSYTVDAYHARSTPGHTERLIKQNRFNSIINAAPVFRAGTFSAVSKNGKPVRSDPAMRKYRDLFEQEFGGKSRLLDIAAPASFAASGLPLGIKNIPAAEACAILNSAELPKPEASSHQADSLMEKNSSMFLRKETMSAFIAKETEILKQLKDMLTGEALPEPARLEELLDSADYLWAHFPDCAGAGGRRPPGTDIGFLKRVRAEIDPFLKLWEALLK